MADPPVKDASASSVLHDPPDPTAEIAKQSNKGKEPEIIEVGEQHGVPGRGGPGSCHPRGDWEVAPSGVAGEIVASDGVDGIDPSVADGKTGASGKDEQTGLSCSHVAIAVCGEDEGNGPSGANVEIVSDADRKISASVASGLPKADGGTGNCGGGEVAPDPASVPRSLPRSSSNPNELHFVEDNPTEPWFEAIEKKDCRRLMEILRVTPYVSRAPLCHRTGKEGRTALHVAAMQGCFRLAKQVIDYKVNETSETVADLERALMQRIDISKSAEDFIDAKDGRSGLIAYEMAKDIIGNRSITQYIKYVKEKDYEIMFEAYPGTEWHTALAEGDCDMLQILIQCNPRYLFETCKGFSVLDVAILQDNDSLVQSLVDRFGSNRIIRWDDSYFPTDLSWDRMIGPRHLIHINNPWLKGTMVGEITRKQLGVFTSASSALELAKKLKRPGSIKVLERSEDKGERLEGMKFSRVIQNEHERLQSEIPAIINQRWKHEWEEAFLADVDYNFEDEHSLRYNILRIHYACKHFEKFGEYILATIGQLLENDYASFFDGSNIYLCVTYDGQGRTLFHTMVQYYNYKNHSNFTFEKLLLPDEKVFWRFYGIIILSSASDSNGRHPLVRAITKQYHESETMVSAHLVRFYETLTNISGERCFDFNMSWNDVWLICTSMLFQDEYVQRDIIQGNEPTVRKVLDFLNRGDNFKYNPNDQTPFPVLFAAAAGNQSLLRLLLKMKFNPMIIDKEGKTSLHYAADGNMFKFSSPPLNFYCSIEDRRKVEDKRMKKEKEEIQPDVNSNAQSNVKSNHQPNEYHNSQSSVGRRACILMLLQAGVDLSQEDKNGDIPDPGTTNDASFQSWWYDILVKDTIDKKNNFNLAGNALSVVGTLVAATSYIGPLQPPLSYNDDTGYVETSKVLVKVFMVTNTLAFYLAVASVMFAVVPSLPMPQEGVIDELRRARHTVSSSLCLLLASIGCILVSFAAASAVVVENEHYYGSHDFLLSPSIIGWFFCLIAIVSFFIRLMRLIFYKSTIIRHIYKFSFSAFCMEGGTFIFYAFYMGVYGIRYFLFDRWRRAEGLQYFLQYRKEVFNQLWMG